MTAAAGGDRWQRAFYSAVWTVATPFVAIYLLHRSRRQPAYRLFWNERFRGRYQSRPSIPCLWIHAVSVGETRAAAPLVAALRNLFPATPLLVTHMTPTGRETAHELWGDDVFHAYLAYDRPQAIAAFFEHWRPSIGIVMETEIWPNLMAAAESRGIPMVLANGRLSPRSLMSTLRWPTLMRPAARRFARILAQSEDDAGRFAVLAGEDRSISVAGNLKFDVKAPAPMLKLGAAFRRGLHPRGVFLCASTREGEEAPLFDAWQRHDTGNLLLVVVPRHPQRFDAVAEAARSHELQLQRRSARQPISTATRVWLGDSMGELFAYYAAADLAYVGGSLVPLGGQNLIEAAAAGCPILIGPHTFNFAAVADEAVRVGAALRVESFDALVTTGLALMADGDRRLAMSEAGIAFAAAHRGATARTVNEIAAAWGGGRLNSRP